MIRASSATRSALGNPRTFTFTAVLKRASAAPAAAVNGAAADEAQATAEHALAGRRALIVEDNAINRQILDRLLRRLGMLVEFANNLENGYENLACCVLGIRGSLIRNDKPVAAAITRHAEEP